MASHVGEPSVASILFLQSVVRLFLASGEICVFYCFFVDVPFAHGFSSSFCGWSYLGGLLSFLVLGVLSLVSFIGLVHLLSSFDSLMLAHRGCFFTVACRCS